MEILATIGYVLLALLSLCVVIIVHELGHYTVGRLLGFRILEFSVGFGPAIWQKEKNGILYSVRPIPLGGYCRFYGEDEDPDEKPGAPVEGAMNDMPAWKRICVLAAGVTFNAVFAFLIAVTMFAFSGITVMRIQTADAGGAAYGIAESGDVILKVNGSSVYSGNELSAAVAAGQPFTLTVDRDGTIYDLTLAPRTVTGEDGSTSYKIGVTLEYAANYRLGAGETVGYGFGYCVYLLDNIISTFEGLFKGAIGLDQVGGPVSTVVEMVKLEQQIGAGILIDLIILISLNLALFNILPIPSLDGARILFTAIYAVVEKILGRKVSRKAESYIHAAGIVILFAFIIFIEIMRLTKLF